MPGIIRDIYRREFKSIERMYMKNPSISFEKVEMLLHSMKRSIPAEYHSILEQYQSEIMNLIDESCEGDFVVGYQLGVRMMLAAWPQENM